MGKINVLDFEIANLIAAGEVVERPSSVLKELIENSIDSGAKKIIAEIKRGGVSLIRVSDNGCGMSAEDLPVAIKRHATSKIRTREDLEAIGTLGFRGEALAAISAVSKVTIITKTKDAPEASMLVSEGGAIVDISEVGASDGTTVVVEDLFFNVPARRKFLKKDATEAMNVAALVEKIALSRPDIAIQLLIDGNEKFSTPGDGDLYNTVYAVFGKDFATRLIKAEGIANGIEVSGFIGRSDNIKKNRNYENIFINGRYVKSLTVQAALEKAYTSYLAPEGFPVCVLFLQMNPTMVDVNVHPAKLEVKFAGEQPVFEAVYHTVRAALEDNEYRPELTFGNQPKNDRNVIGAFVPIGQSTKGEQIAFGTTFPKIAPTSGGAYSAGSKAEVSPRSFGYPSSRDNEPARPLGGSGSSYSPKNYDTSLRASSGASESYHDNFTKPKADYSSTQESISPKASFDILESYSKAEPQTPRSVIGSTLECPAHKIIGEAFNCYVFVEVDGELLVIDKHAAHERILFEELLRASREAGRAASQSLLLPITVLISATEHSAAEEYRDAILGVGFEYELGDGYANLTCIPESISASEAEGLFVEMLDELASGVGNPNLNDSIRREKALYQVACKAAIKGGRIYDSSIISWLVCKVLTLPDITVCPHGRPIAFKLTKSELDRRFDRLK